MLLFLFSACDPDSGPQGSIDTTSLFPAEEDRFQAYRHQTPDQYADPELADVLDESDLMFARFTATGCSADAWRVELRTGSEWATATAAGALHLDDAAGLSICAWEDSAGALETYEPAIALWDTGTPIDDGDVMQSGDWTATPLREEAVLTYFGTFPKAIAFTLGGDGALDRWVLHFAEGNGLVLLESGDLTADLVYSR